MSGLLDALKAVEEDRPTNCPVGIILADLDDDDRTGLQLVLDGNSIDSVALTKVLRDQGYTLGQRAVANHRRNICSCRRKVDG